MIDRIAAVLYGGNLEDCTFPEYFRRKARQVLEAIKEPTPAMVLAGSYHIYEGPNDAKESAHDAWQDMIDVALDEK